jgi:hypothetical protein
VGAGFLCLLYGLLIVLGRSFGFAVLTSAVSIGVNEDDDSSSSTSVGMIGIFCWFEASFVAVFKDPISSGPGGVGIFRLNDDLGLLQLPSVNGSIGGMFDVGVSMDISILTGVECARPALVLEVFGVEGVGGGSIVEVEVLLVLG